MSPIFGVEEQKCQIAYTTENEPFASPFPNMQTLSKSVELLSRNHNPNMAKNEHGNAICCRHEVVDNVTSCEDAETFRDYLNRNQQFM